MLRRSRSEDTSLHVERRKQKPHGRVSTRPQPLLWNVSPSPALTLSWSRPLCSEHVTSNCYMCDKMQITVTGRCASLHHRGEQQCVTKWSLRVLAVTVLTYFKAHFDLKWIAITRNTGKSLSASNKFTFGLYAQCWRIAGDFFWEWKSWQLSQLPPGL